MRFSARVVILALCLSIFSFAAFPSYALAQSTTNTTTNYTNPYLNPYNMPNTEGNVPANQHTRVQTLFIDITSATMCLLVGIDPVDKKRPCLDVNPETGKIGYNPASFDENGQPKLGGVLGASTTLLGVLYTPTISSGQYGDYLARNFGIVKPAYAQEDVGYGFTGLNSLIVLWTAMRNIAYFLLMLAFVLIGLGVMLRVKIDPRTVMTLQNQIPRIVICILLVTFSYPIAGLMIDTMWLTTYIGINVITSAGGPEGGSPTNPIIPGDDSLEDINPNKPDMPLSQKATINLLQMPITYINEVFRAPDTPASGNTNIDSGIGHITDEVSYSIGTFLEELVRQVLGTDQGQSCVSWTGVDPGACLAGILGWFAKILLWVIILFILLKTMFSVWFTLIKAYTYVIIYTIAGPLFIVMGLLPGKPLGFEKWWRSLLANLAPFPLVAWILVLARLFVELFGYERTGTAAAGGAQLAAADPNRFIPPLVGNPNIVGLMGWIIAFGLILMTPAVLQMMQEALKVPGNKYGGAAIGGAIAAGAVTPKAIGGTIVNRAWRRAKYGEHDAGWLRRIAAGTGTKYDTKQFSLTSPKSWVDTVQRARSKLAAKDAHGGDRYDKDGKKKF